VKRIVLTAVAAICIAYGVSAHKIDHPSRLTHFFKWLAKKLRGQPAPPASNSDLFHPSYDTSPAGMLPVNPCSGGSYWCIVGFSTGQLTGGGNYLNTASGNQTPVTAAYSKII
jgi:hypothetical protein